MEVNMEQDTNKKDTDRYMEVDICSRTVDGRLSSLPAAAVNSLTHEKGEVNIRSGHEMTTNIHIHHSYSETKHSSFTLLSATTLHSAMSLFIACG